MIKYFQYQGILNKKILQHKMPMELMNINSRRNLRLQLTPLQKRSYPYISNGYIVVPQPPEVGRALTTQNYNFFDVVPKELHVLDLFRIHISDCKTFYDFK